MVNVSVCDGLFPLGNQTFVADQHWKSQVSTGCMMTNKPKNYKKSEGPLAQWSLLASFSSSFVFPSLPFWFSPIKISPTFKNTNCSASNKVFTQLRHNMKKKKAICFLSRHWHAIFCECQPQTSPHHPHKHSPIRGSEYIVYVDKPREELGPAPKINPYWSNPGQYIHIYIHSSGNALWR